ncbi:MAG TPA: hypothetical protein VFI31_19970 [Pirellulales bacterium]|nr:hypothetical protein [Pirellulales bacterium]
MNRPKPPKEPLRLQLDSAGPYVVLATKRSREAYAPAIQKALALHAGAERLEFEPDHLDALLDELKKKQPRYALVFIQPEELDVNFAWQWLKMTAQLDDDPFVDVRTGFVTSARPEAAEAFVDRMARAANGQLLVPGACVDNLGPVEQAPPAMFNTFPAAMMLPDALGQRFTARSISHGKSGFTDERLASMEGAGLVHFGGHGHPDRIDDGLRAVQLPGLKLSPSVVFNGACYTGVTYRWYDQTTGETVEKTVQPDDSFCLRMLEKDVAGYLAALHPDHGMPVYQEMEYLACEGAPLGDVIKHTYDGVVLGAGGKLPDLEPLSPGATLPTTPADVMLRGTAARVLFGDPALIVCDHFLPGPFSVVSHEEGGRLKIQATVSNPDLKSTFTDTFYNDLNPQAPFNDRALFRVELPAGWERVSAVNGIRVTAAGKTVPHRLIGYAVERDGRHSWLHAQIDVPAEGFQQSPLRAEGSTVELVAEH